ncbi:MAG: helix-turn-helix transcriptional regulator [Anaeroplasma bactoclasticum]|nr:helix-turn-helix transcriptional regulator [Anaeroplasma bactoclasticum]
MKNNKEFDLFEELVLTDKEQAMVERIHMISSIIFEIVKQRNEKNLSQRDIEEITGIKQPMIARIETLKSIPRLDTLVSLCQAVGTRLGIMPLEDDIIPLNLNIHIEFDAEVQEPKFNFILKKESAINAGLVC